MKIPLIPGSRQHEDRPYLGRQFGKKDPLLAARQQNVKCVLSVDDNMGNGQVGS